MQPTFRQVPPRVALLSIRATLSPSCAARNAHTYPPGPAPMTAMSYGSIGGRASDPEQEPRRVLDLLLHLDEERHGLAAVDDAVVVGQRGVHHGPDDDLAAHGHGPVLDRVQAQDGALGGVDDRRRQEGAEGAPVRDREDAALEVGERYPAVAGLASRVRYRLLDRGQAEAVAVADNRDHQPALRRDRHAYVIEVVLHQRVAIDLGVDRRHLLQGLDHRLHEERHETKLHPVPLDEVLLVPRAELHDGGHVDLVEGREQGGLVLRGDEALADALAQLGELPPGLAGAGRRLGARPRVPGAGGRLAGREHVGLGHAAALSRAGDRRRVDAGLVRKPAHRGGHHDRGRRAGLRPWRRRGGRGRLGRRGGAGPRLDRGHDLADPHLRALRDLERDDARRLGRGLGGDLVGLELEERLVPLHQVAVPHVPLGEYARAYRLPHGRYPDIDWHVQRVYASLSRLASSSLWRASEPTAGEAEASRPA